MISLATLFGQPDSSVVVDLTETRRSAEALLAALVHVPAGVEPSIAGQVAADLQQGLWVRKGFRVPPGSYEMIGYGTLDRHAAALVGHRYVFVGEVTEIHDAGGLSYYTGFPYGLQPEVWVALQVTGQGYGDWGDDVTVVCDRALRDIRQGDIVAVYGSCDGWDRRYHPRVPLTHAGVVSKLGHESLTPS